MPKALNGLMRHGALLASTAAVLLSSGAAVAQDVPALQDLGKRVFFQSISNPPRQSCSSCHVASNGWTGQVAAVNLKGVSIPGANPHVAGGRKPPSNAYASLIPPFGTTPPSVTVPLVPPALACGIGIGPFCTGGGFWDGRAEGGASPLVSPPNVLGTGATLHVGTEIFSGKPALQAAYGRFIGPAADQALGPFPNDVEQNVPDGADHGVPGAQAVCLAVQSAPYAVLYQKAWGEPIECTNAPDVSFKRIALAIASWEASPEVNSFSAKRDQGKKVKDANGNTVFALPFSSLTAQENLGHDLFYGRNDSGLNPTLKSANCALCHNNHNSLFLGPALGSKGDELDQIYTDFAYHHIGVPPNYEINNFDPNHGDPGLEGHASPGVAFDASNPNATPLAGHFKTPTLRNVDKRVGAGFVKAYMHNGYFKSLEQVVHFYNTSIKLRDPVKCPPGTTADQAMARGCWPTAEFDTPNQAGKLVAAPGGPGLIGDMGLTASEEAAVVAFLKTLTDTQTPKAPLPFTPVAASAATTTTTTTAPAP